MASSKKKGAVKKSKAPAPKKSKVAKAKPHKSAPKSSVSEPMPLRRVSQSVQASLNEIKSELNLAPAYAPQEVGAKKPPMVLDKVYLQSMSFEMASMRQALDRIGRQLDKLERELSAHRQAGDE
ncbi:MAG: hypothetical protein WC492_01965 [Candidatus Micrarchaeia archaeon]